MQVLDLLCSACELHKLQWRVDVTRVARRKALLIGSLTLSGPIVRHCGRGTHRSGGGESLRTYKKVFGKTRLPTRDARPALLRKLHLLVLNLMFLSLSVNPIRTETGFTK